MNWKYRMMHLRALAIRGGTDAGVLVRVLAVGVVPARSRAGGVGRIDGDGLLGHAGDFSGAWPTATDPDALTIVGNVPRPNLDFDVTWIC